jgi:hypothetical protein
LLKPSRDREGAIPPNLFQHPARLPKRRWSFGIIALMKKSLAPGAGIAVGIAIGVAMHNIGLGIALGVLFGAVFAAVAKRRGPKA